MNCPKCNKYILDNLTSCPHCGETLRINIMIDDDFVFNEVVPEEPEPKSKYKIVLIVIIALILCIGGVAAWVLTHQSPSTTPVYKPTEATQTEAAATQADTAVVTQAQTAPATAAPTTVAPATQAPQTTAAISPEQRLEEYARTSGMLDMLKKAADEHTTISVKGEENALRARYRVDLDSSLGENTEYFELLPNTYNDLCSQMDRMIYDMNRQSDINNAVLEVYVFDSNDKQVYSRTVD